MLQANVPWSGFDTFVIISYLILMVLIGLRFRGKANKSMSSYFLSGRSLALPLVIGTMMTSWYDGYSIVGVAQYGATIGIAGMIVYVIPCTLTRIPFALWIAPFVRGRIPEDCLTIPDLLEYFYDRKAKVLGAIAVNIGILYNGVNMLVISQLLQYMFNFPPALSVIISGLIVAIYVLSSGMWSVTMTDVFQFVYMSLSVGIAVIMVSKNVGGFEAIYNALNDVQPELFQPTGGMAPARIIAWGLIGMSIYTEPMMYQRFSASDSARTAKRSFLFCIPMWLVFSSAVIFIGMAARTFHPDLEFYQAFWTTVLNALPTGLRGLFVAGLIAAVMSTLSSMILVQAAACTRDLYSGITGKVMDDQRMIKHNKTATVFIIIFSMLSTQAWLESLIDGFFFIEGILIAGLFVPIVFGIFYRKKTEQAGWISMIFGFILWPIWEFFIELPWDIPANSIVWFLSMFVYLAVCKATYKEDTPKLEVK
ncbi:MAG TPA: sodium:solute symporter family protein [Anaerovoracaceae bacterium]|nr:sodium:solute symporter family protein [Anaerovoracaceae bacterium]